ncbi:DUF4259 domain-containing protein [Streptomyces sp. NPDC097617]|uniref:DUF4259 domain-containing protein n=1 Tax=Streptomyces sp. NPDC097617 TaxID=3366091 RepID=UPI0038141386
MSECRRAPLVDHSWDRACQGAGANVHTTTAADIPDPRPGRPLRYRAGCPLRLGRRRGLGVGCRLSLRLRPSEALYGPRLQRPEESVRPRGRCGGRRCRPPRAADFADALDEAAQNEREALVRSTLIRAIQIRDYLESPEGAEAIAVAAALIAAQCREVNHSAQVTVPTRPCRSSPPAFGSSLRQGGMCAAVPECWPPEVEQAGFLGTLMRLTEDVVTAASAVHGLGDPKPLTKNASKVRVKTRARRLRPEVLVAHHDVLPDVLDAGRVVAAARQYEDFVRSWITSPWAHGTPKLANALTHYRARSTFATVMDTFEEGAAVTVVFAARMLLEEAGRSAWLTQDPQNKDAFVQRSAQYFNEFRAKKKSTIAAFAGNGVALAAATRLLKMPDHVIEGPETITKGRTRLPSVDKMLLLMGANFPEPGWLSAAYSLLSQVTHSTPIGLMHMTSYRDHVLTAGAISPEMLALALDVACLGSATLIGGSGLMLTQGSAGRRRRAIVKSCGWGPPTR